MSLALVGAVQIHRPDVGDQAAFVEAPPDDALAVGREERAAVVARNAGQPADAGAVGVRAHDVDLAEVARVGLELLLFGGGELPVVRVARGREDDPLTVGRVACLGVVAALVRQPAERAGCARPDVQLHLRVVVPRYRRSWPDARNFSSSSCSCFERGSWCVDANSTSPVSGLMNEQVVLPSPGDTRDTSPRRHIHQVDLIKGIARLPLALKDQPLAVGRPVALAGAPAFHRQAPDPAEKSPSCGAAGLLSQRRPARTAAEQAAGPSV